MSQGSTSNGPAADVEDDTFERDLKEMLKDGPSLNDLSSTVQGGNPVGPGAPPAAAMRGVAPGQGPNMQQQQRPQTMHPQGTSFGATSSIPLSSPERNGSGEGLRHSAVTSPGGSSKIDVIKAWTINTYKCTRQAVAEKLGRTTRTVDADLESQIETLRDTQRRYSHILRTARALASHFTHVVATQRQLGDAFCEMSQRNPELQNEFQYNAETQKVLCKNGETLLGAINFFASSLETLVSKTISDTLTTVERYNQARLEFDAYRAERDALASASQRDAASMARLTESEATFALHKEKFDKLRADVAIKLKFLDENKVKVMHKQLLLFHNAVAAYFSGNQEALEATLKQFNIKLKPPNTDKPSWLEQ